MRGCGESELRRAAEFGFYDGREKGKDGSTGPHGFHRDRYHERDPRFRTWFSARNRAVDNRLWSKAQVIETALARKRK